MNNQSRLFSWPRLLLWSHALAIVTFYLILWFRTNPPTKSPVGADVSRPPHPKNTSDPTVSVSIIVPARDEQDNIRRCVTSLLEQDYDNYEVIVVDDGSTDNTPHILDDITHHHPRGAKLQVIHLHGLPSGWAGKPHALHSGVQEAHGDWLLFTDADTWHAPNALRASVSRSIEGKIDLYTLGTMQELPGFWNKVMMPVAYMGISMQYPIAKVNDPDSPIAIANGQYILIRRAVYDITGGYARPDLRGTLLDDRDLARIVKQNGFRLYMDDGRDLVHVYMYSNLRDTWRGWRKNAYLGSRGGLPFVLLELIGLPMVAIVPCLLPFLALFIRRRNLILAAALELTSVLSYRAWLDRNLAVPWYYAFTYPLGAALFTGILAESAWRVLTRKGVEWSGRKYYGE